jgi:transcription elongation GreA/GreB family factor
LKKFNLISHCITLQEKKVAELKKLVDTLNESALGEDKCTVGDKHHTFRAQTQNEQEIYAKQLNMAIKDLNYLQTLVPKKSSNSVESGSLVSTTNGLYFIATSMGIVDFNGIQVFVVSAISPIASQLLSKKAGDEIVFNRQKIEIGEVQ